MLSELNEIQNLKKSLDYIPSTDVMTRLALAELCNDKFLRKSQYDTHSPLHEDVEIKLTNLTKDKLINKYDPLLAQNMKQNSEVQRLQHIINSQKTN